MRDLSLFSEREESSESSCRGDGSSISALPSIASSGKASKRVEVDAFSLLISFGEE